MSATTMTTATATGNKTIFNIGYVNRFCAINPDYQEFYNGNVIDCTELAKAWNESMKNDGNESYYGYICSIQHFVANPVERTWYQNGVFTMDNVLKDMGLRSHDGSANAINEPLAIELGKFINLFLTDRPFQKVMVNVSGKNMSVKLYYHFERDEIENLVKIFFNRLDLINPSNRVMYEFSVNTLFSDIASSLDDTDPVKGIITNMFLHDHIQCEDNRMTFQESIMDNIPIELLVPIPTDNSNEDDETSITYEFPANYRLFAENAVISMARYYLE
jgi:hypothetical protein